MRPRTQKELDALDLEMAKMIKAKAEEMGLESLTNLSLEEIVKVHIKVMTMAGFERVKLPH